VVSVNLAVHGRLDTCRDGPSPARSQKPRKGQGEQGKEAEAVSEAADLHQQMWDAVNSRDFAALRALYHPDYAYTGTDGQEHKGAEAGVAVAQTYTSAFPDLSLEVRRRYDCGGDVSIMELAGRGTHQGELEGIAPTGRPAEAFNCNIIEVRDGKIYRERDYFDRLALLEQLGIAPEAGK